MHLIIQHTEQTVEIALFDNAQCRGSVAVEKSAASALLIPKIQELLTTNNLQLSDLDFIAANAGPGPFTTLRTILATVNGLGYAVSIPLIGIDGLDAMLDEVNPSIVLSLSKGANAKHFRRRTSPLSDLQRAHPEFIEGSKRENELCRDFAGRSGLVYMALFNAFAGDLYFGIDANDKRTKGWKPHRQLFEEIKAHYDPSIHFADAKHSGRTASKVIFVGSGVLLYKDLIVELFGAQAIPDPLPMHPSLDTLNGVALRLFEHKQISDQLLPLYLKTPTVTNKTVHFV